VHLNLCQRLRAKLLIVIKIPPVAPSPISNTGISESVVIINSTSVATVSIAVPDAVGDTGSNDSVLSVEQNYF